MRDRLRRGIIMASLIGTIPAAVCAQEPPAQQMPSRPGGPRGSRDPLMLKYQEARRAGDSKAALDYLTQAAKTGNPDAESQLAGVYRSGSESELARLVQPDPQRADALTRSAIAHGSTRAMEDEGLALMTGSRGHKDYAASFTLFAQSDAAGSTKAGRFLGMFYQHGWSVPVDDVKAAGYYRRAAEAGDITSQCLLGAMYEGGLGVERSNALAAQWYLKSAERGDPIASGGMSALGHLYETRADGQRDVGLATQWYAKAAAQDNAEAKASMARLVANGPPPAASPFDLCVSPSHH